MRSALLLLFLLITEASSAQRQIHIADSKTNESIGGAVVRIRDSSGKQLSVQTTNFRGIVRINLPEKGAVLIRALGYRDTLLSAFTGDSILLEPEYIKQQDIIITAQRHTSASQDVPISVSAVRIDEISDRTPKQIDEVLRFIPGVTVTEDQVSIRGSSGYARSVGSRVLFMLDGMPILSADNSDIKFDAIPLLSIDRIEVIKGAGSALYGSNALGGIINVLTREASPSLKAGITLSGGMYDKPSYPEWDIPSLQRRYYNLEAGFSNTYDGTGVVANAAYRRDEKYRLGDDSYKWNGLFKISRSLSQNTDAALSILYASDDHGSWLYWRGLHDPYKPSDSLAAVNERILSTKLNIFASVRTILDGAGVVTTKFSSFRTSFSNSSLVDPDTALPHSTAYTHHLDVEYGLPISDVFFLTSGIVGSLTSVNSDLFQDHNGSSAGLYVQGEYTLGSIIFTAGSRADMHRYDDEKFTGSISPKIGMSWKAIDEITLRSSFGAGYRAPSVTEKFTDQILSGFTIKPNPSLVPERSTSLEVGAMYRTKELTIDAAVFSSRFRRLIEPSFVTIDARSFIQFRNISDAEIYGHEEYIEYTPFDALSLRCGYTYIYPYNISQKQILNFRPRHLLQSRIEGKFIGVSASADLRYVSAYESLDPILIQQIPDAAARVAAYILDARLSYPLNDIGIPLTVGVQMQNLLNYYYVEIAGNMAPPRSITFKIESIF